MSDIQRRFKEGDKVVRTVGKYSGMVVGGVYTVKEHRLSAANGGAGTLAIVDHGDYADPHNFELAKHQIIKDIINDL